MLNGAGELGRDGLSCGTTIGTASGGTVCLPCGAIGGVVGGGGEPCGTTAGAWTCKAVGKVIGGAGCRGTVVGGGKVGANTKFGKGGKGGKVNGAQAEPSAP